MARVMSIFWWVTRAAVQWASGGIVAKEKRIKLNLEFYLRGKKRTPSVTMAEGDDGYGVPLTSHSASASENAAFAAFHEACVVFCKQIAAHGELK